MKIEGWEKKLSELIKKASKKKFAYGEFDCCLFASNVIESLTGINPREIIAEQYQNEEEAEKVLSRYGGVEGIANAVAEKYVFKSIPILFAQRGDIVMAKIKEVKSLGVCIGKKCAFSKLGIGLAYINIDSKLLSKKAWRI